MPTTALKKIYFLSQIQKYLVATSATNMIMTPSLDFLHEMKFLDTLTILNLNVFVSKMGQITIAVRII